MCIGRPRRRNDDDATTTGFIAAAPFVMLATTDAEGRPDVSPKGDHPGLVVVEDDRTLLVPDRKANKLAR